MRYPKASKKADAPAEHPPLPLESCLAKSRKIDVLRSVAGRTVLDHCRIAGAVARELIARSPAYLREPFFPGGSALVAACHDLGKVCPTFQKKIHAAIENADPEILAALRDADSEIEKNWGGHAGVSQCALDALNAGKAVASIAGCHHGYAPKLGGRSADAEQFGGPAWQLQRARLMARLMEATGEQFPEIRDPLHTRVLAGLTSVADWIGSGAAFDDPGEPWQERVAAAVDSAGFTPPRLRPGLSFREIFPFEPNPIQRGLIDAACRPGVYILEAPMGIGKTEAALYAAFGLAGKVVILDEVHSYDAYTGTILDRLVEELRRLRCTVIILSATLTGERRNSKAVRDAQEAEINHFPY